MIMCVRLVVEANDINGKSAKLRKLNALNIELDVLRTLLRVAFEFGFMSGKSLAFGIKNIDDVGRSVGAWIQSCSAEPSSKGE